MKKPFGLRFETEVSWFLFAGLLDVLLTWLALRFSAEGRTTAVFLESNPVANWVLAHWGIRGMVLFKLALSALVVAIAEFVGRTRPLLAQALLWGGTFVVGTVVLYTVRLIFLHR